MRPIDYLSVLRRHKWHVLWPALVVACVALIASLFQAPTYLARIDVLLTGDSASAVSFGPVSPEAGVEREPRLQTQVNLVQQSLLLERVIRKLHLPTSAGDLAARTSAAMVEQTNVMTIEVVDSDAGRAARTADALATEYVVWARDLKRASVSTARAEVARSLTVAERQIAAIESAGGQTESERVKLAAARAWYATLAEKYEQLRFSEQAESGSGSIVASATVDPTPVSPRPFRNGALGLVVGLAIGLTLASRAEYLDDSVRSPEEAEVLYGAPVLGRIPAEKQVEGTARPLEVLHRPGSATATAFRMLGNRLISDNVRRDVGVLVVASPTSGEGRSTVAANLAVVLSQAGEKVMLIACDFRHPTMGQLLNTDSAVGVSDILTGQCPAASAFKRLEGLDNLRVLMEGTQGDHPGGLLGSAAMGKLMVSVGEWADWIIMDMPPLLEASDDALVIHWADGVLMVTRRGISTRAAAGRGCAVLQKLSRRIIGVVALEFRGRAAPQAHPLNMQQRAQWSDLEAKDPA